MGAAGAAPASRSTGAGIHSRSLRPRRDSDATLDRRARLGQSPLVRKLLVISAFLAAACGKSSKSDKAEPPPTPGSAAPKNDDAALIAEAKQFAADMDKELRKLYVDASQAAWTNATDITPEHEKAEAAAGAEQAKGITRLIKASKK